MTTEQDQLTERQYALLNELATINSFGQPPSLHYWTRDYNDTKGRFEDELLTGPDVAVLIGKRYVVAVPGGGYPQYLVTPAGWDVLGDKPGPTARDLLHDYLGHPTPGLTVGR